MEVGVISMEKIVFEKSFERGINIDGIPPQNTVIINLNIFNIFKIMIKQYKNYYNIHSIFLLLNI